MSNHNNIPSSEDSFLEKSGKIRLFYTIELYKLNNILTRKAQNFLSQQVNDEEFSLINGWILRYVKNNEDNGVYQKDLEEEFCFTKSTASKIVRLMEKKEMLSGEEDEKDARRKKLHVISKIYRLPMRETMRYIEEKLLQGFTKEERFQLMCFIQRMNNNMRQGD